MRQLFAFIVGEFQTNIHVMVITDNGTGVINIQANDTVDAMDKVGITSKNFHDVYDSLFPEGWNIEWVTDPENHEKMEKSLHLNRLKMMN